MLHVSKLGATELGKGTLFHMLESMFHSVPAGSPPLPRGMPMLLRLIITQLPLSVRLRSWARICVYPISSICSICRNMVSNDSDTLLTSTRSGIGSLQVRIDGFGSLISAETRGESEEPSRREVVETFWNKLFVLEGLGGFVN